MNAQKYITAIGRNLVNQPWLSLLFFLSVFSFIYLEVSYRPFLLKLESYNYYFANTYPNVMGLYIAIFGSLLVSPTNNVEERAFLITIGFVVYEIAQNFIPYATFDYMDIAASIFSFIALTAVTVTLRWLHRD